MRCGLFFVYSSCVLTFWHPCIHNVYFCAPFFGTIKTIDILLLYIICLHTLKFNFWKFSILFLITILLPILTSGVGEYLPVCVPKRKNRGCHISARFKFIVLIVYNSIKVFGGMQLCPC